MTLGANAEPWLRAAAAVGVFGAMALFELVASRRELRHARNRRWVVNLSLAFLDALVVRLLLPTAALGAAITAQANGWGLLNQVELPGWAGFVSSVLVLDLAIYGQHLALHAIPQLWRFHMVHHADRDFDVTTGLRFHPVEIILSLAFKIAVITLLGIPPAAVLCFEILLNATSLFNHANVALPRALDRVLRWVLVTPDMHRVHHSVHRDETDSNFGFNLPWWDHAFGTYRAQPRDGHTNMTIGVASQQGTQPDSFLSVLALPFRRRR